MTRPCSPDVERRALALLERLVENPGNSRLRERLLRSVSEPIRARVTALEAAAARVSRLLPTEFDLAAEDFAAQLGPGTRIGAFRLTAPVGRGGMGEVWAAERADGLYAQRVAIKVIRRRTSPAMQAAFAKERQMLAKLEHPHIARLIDGGVARVGEGDEGLPWLAMEFCDGQPIDEAAAGLSARARIALFVKAADAIRFAHGRMIAHADIKPSNILVDGAGQVKLLDFGIATVLDGAAAGEQAAAPSACAPGPLTREFASPQRLAGAGSSVADDVFALGRTLAAVLATIDDAELSAIVGKASAAAEADRYASVDALIADLDRWASHLVVSAMPQTRRYRLDKFVARNRRWVLITGVALVLIGAISAYATRSSVQAEIARTREAARSNELRQLTRYMLFDLYDQLARQPGTVEKREQIAARAVDYLARLQADRGASPAMRLDAARSYRRLAAIQGLPGMSNLGDPDRAAVSLGRAEAILAPLVAERPRDAAALAELGWVYADRWSLHADNRDSPTANREARRWFDAALAAAPREPAALLGRLTTIKSEGYDLIWSKDRPAEALPLLRAALGELRRISWPASFHESVTVLEINLLNRIGDALYYTDAIAESLAPYREADVLVDSLIATRGAAPHWQILKAESAFNISGSLGDSGRKVEALAVADAGVAALRQTLASGVDAAAEKRLLILYGQQAALLDEAGRGREALVPSTASVKLREARLARSPDNPQRMRDLAIGLVPHARLSARLGQQAQACTAVARAVAIWSEIRAQGRLGSLDARKNVPQSEALRGEFCRR